MIDFFVRPHELYNSGNTIKVNGKEKTFQEIRQTMYENIIEEVMFVARASEGAISVEWLMNEPIFIRKKYVKSFTEELKEREKALNKKV